MMNRGLVTFCAGWLALLVGVFAVPVKAQGAADFYAGKRITYLVQGEAGTGYDQYARLIARHVERHLPNTRIRIQNLLMGGGGILFANRVYESRPDGLTMATLNSGLIYTQLQSLPGARFDLAQMGWIGKAAAEPRVVYTGRASGLSTLAELQALATVRIATVGGVGTASHIDAVLMARALGLDARTVTFSSSGEALMSLMRGEVHARVGSFSSAQRFVAAGNGLILARIGPSPEGDPTLIDARTRVVGTDGERIVDLIQAVGAFSRMTVLPPGVDPARVDYLRSVYQAAVTDPRLRAEAVELGLPMEPESGEQLQVRIADVLQQPAAVRSLLAELAPGAR